MKDWIATEGQAILNVFISTVLIFSILILWVRVSGLRSFAKISSIDFASTIAIGSVLASTVLSADPSIIKSGMAIGFILGFQTLFSKLTLKFNWFNTLASNSPMLLMDKENILYDNLYSNNLSEEDLYAKLREVNVLQLSEIKAVILETTGDITVLHGSVEKEIDVLLLKGVRSK
ncbi:DUF421 domain-containing protein [Arenibacter certesii]|uniref:DUF421 domain-containing protein n=1 Tax=Arenibacter certesii TaxID=228955 RepID=A0A918MN58_9FLAO|nr:YetF domain-containing protein [Arenibacter certesii]GGW42671.1 DUF421 domain-containing protein [Arenibacter certesii]